MSNGLAQAQWAQAWSITMKLTKPFRGDRKIMNLVCFIRLAPFVFLLGSLQHANHVLLAIALCGMGFSGNMA